MRRKKDTEISAQQLASLPIDKLIDVYRTSDYSDRILIERLFPDAAPWNEMKDVTDRVKTFNDACKIALKRDEDYFSRVMASGEKDMDAYIKLRIIAKALNSDAEREYDWCSHKMYWPRFEYDFESREIAFKYVDSTWNGCMAVPFSVAYYKEDLAKYSGTHFIKLWTDFLTEKPQKWEFIQVAGR